MAMPAETICDGLTIFRPVQWQVVQRRADDTAVLPIEVISPEASSLEVRVVPATRSKQASSPWCPLSSSQTGRFGGAVRVDAGGWYILEVRAVMEDRTLLHASVENVGIGEVFVAAGQSNSANHGSDGESALMKCRDSRGVSYGEGRWQRARDPFPGATGTGGSPWCPFLDALVESLNVPVGLASVGAGGSSMSSWLPDTGANYDRIAGVLRYLGRNGARAVLWHQGETDNLRRTSSGQYYDGMKRIIEATQRDAGYELAWFVARASFVPAHQNPPDEISMAVRDAQARLWTDGVAFEGPDTDDMIGPAFRCADGIHMSRNGLAVHGKRWCDSVLKQLG